MIEAYAFLAAFSVQILAMSILYPARFIRHVRSKMASISDERITQLYPDVERFLTRYRLLNSGIAVLGLLLLGWLFSHMQRPNWDEGEVSFLASMYFLLQYSPFGVVYWAQRRSIKVLKRLLSEGRRTAHLQRRGLFNFVSPFVVGLAVLSYFLCAALLLYIQQHPFPGFGGFFANMAGVTFVYACNAGFVYWMLYRKKYPLETYAERMHMTGLVLKGLVYLSIAFVVFLSVILTLSLLSLKRWEPFALTVLWLICALFALMTVRPHQPADGLGSSHRQSEVPS